MKVRVNAVGHKTGGQSIARGALYTLLKNHHYIGQIVHKGTHYEGQHAPIIDAHTWDAVQRKLEDNRNTHAHALRAQSPNLLAGRLFDDKGNAMSPSHAVKRGKRYRYYTSQAVVQLRPETGGSITRLPADEIERVVIQELLKTLIDKGIQRDLLGGDVSVSWSWPVMSFASPRQRRSRTLMLRVRIGGASAPSRSTSRTFASAAVLMSTRTSF